MLTSEKDRLAAEAMGRWEDFQEALSSEKRKDAGQRTPGGIATRDPGASTTEPHHRNHGRNTKPSDSRARRASCRGSRLPIPAQPAPCHRLWITPQGATPAERV